MKEKPKTIQEQTLETFIRFKMEEVQTMNIFREDIEEYIYDVYKRDVESNNAVYGMCLDEILRDLKRMESFVLDENKNIVSEDTFIKWESKSLRRKVVESFQQMVPSILFVSVVVDDFKKWTGDDGWNKGFSSLNPKDIDPEKLYADVLEMISKMPVEAEELQNEWEENSEQIPYHYPVIWENSKPPENKI